MSHGTWGGAGDAGRIDPVTGRIYAGRTSEEIDASGARMQREQQRRAVLPEEVTLRDLAGRQIAAAQAGANPSISQAQLLAYLAQTGAQQARAAGVPVGQRQAALMSLAQPMAQAGQLAGGAGREQWGALGEGAGLYGLLQQTGRERLRGVNEEVAARRRAALAREQAERGIFGSVVGGLATGLVTALATKSDRAAKTAIAQAPEEADGLMDLFGGRPEFQELTDAQIDEAARNFLVALAAEKQTRIGQVERPSMLDSLVDLATASERERPTAPAAPPADPRAALLAKLAQSTVAVGPPERAQPLPPDRPMPRPAMRPPKDRDRFLESLTPYRYAYRDEAPGEPAHLGVMAQDVERTPMGAAGVVRDETGMRRLVADRLMPAILAGMARLGQRVATVEGKGR